MKSIRYFFPIFGMNLFILEILLKHFEYFFLTRNFVSNYLKERKFVETLSIDFIPLKRYLS